MLICRTPYRVSLFGGGSDHPQWFTNHRGKVLSFAIDKYSYLTGRVLPPFFQHNYRVVYSKIETLNDLNSIQHPAFREGLRAFGKEKRYEIHHHGDLPPQSGMGSSSAFAVGLINLLESLSGTYQDPQSLAKEAIRLERDILKENVGWQDQVAVAFGGINSITFENRSWNIQSIHLSHEQISELEDRCYLVFTGIQRSSSDITKSLFTNFGAKENFLSRLVSIADEGANQIQKKTNLDFVGDLLNESWQLKKRTNSETSNKKLDDFIENGLACGAQAAKILGAGGGGFVLFWLPPDYRKKFKDKFAFGIDIPFKLDFQGSKILG